MWFTEAVVARSVAGPAVRWGHAGQQEARMRFDENADLDTSNIDDLRGGGGGGGPLGGRVALGGGGLGIVGIILYLLISFLGGAVGGGGGGGLPFPGGLGGIEQGQTGDTSQAASACQSGQQANTELDCEVVAVVNSLDGYWTDAFARSGQTLPAAAHQLLLRRREHRLRQRQPARGRSTARATTDLHRPVVLPRAGDPIRCPGRGVLPGLRDLPRVRPPHPEPPGHHQPGAARRPRSDIGLGAAGAAGRLLRRRLGQPRHVGARPRPASR